MLQTKKTFSFVAYFFKESWGTEVGIPAVLCLGKSGQVTSPSKGYIKTNIYGHSHSNL